MPPLDQLDTIIHGWFAQPNSNAEAMFRLILAIIAGGLTGLEREHRGRSAGFRTTMLVCVGAAMAMIVSYHVSMLDLQPSSGRVNINVDPGRIAYGIMVGVGFLGSGAILRAGATVRGLTTAANIWCMAAVGLAYGLGMYVLGTACVLLVLLVLMLFHKLEHLFPKIAHRCIVVRRPWAPGCLDEVRKRFTSKVYRLKDMTFDRTKNPEVVDFTLRLTFETEQDVRRIEQELSRDPDYQLVAVSDD